MAPLLVLRSDSIEFMRFLGSAVRRRRLQLSLTELQLAAATSLSTRAITRLEVGDVRLSLLQLSAVASALDVPLPRLLKNAEKRARTDKGAGHPETIKVSASGRRKSKRGPPAVKR